MFVEVEETHKLCIILKEGRDSPWELWLVLVLLLRIAIYSQCIPYRSM